MVLSEGSCPQGSCPSDGGCASCGHHVRGLGGGGTFSYTGGGGRKDEEHISEAGGGGEVDDRILQIELERRPT